MQAPKNPLLQYIHYKQSVCTALDIHVTISQKGVIIFTLASSSSSSSDISYVFCDKTSDHCTNITPKVDPMKTGPNCSEISSKISFLCKTARSVSGTL